MKNVVERSSFTAQAFGDGIVRMDLKEVTKFNVEDVLEMYEAYRHFGKGKKVVVLATCEKYVPFSEEAMQYARTNSVKYVAGTAMVVKNNMNRIAIQFYLNFYKPKHPFKVFSTTDQALAWIYSKMDRKENALVQA